VQRRHRLHHIAMAESQPSGQITDDPQVNGYPFTWGLGSILIRWTSSIDRANLTRW
jgi:hypothetical protein